MYYRFSVFYHLLFAETGLSAVVPGLFPILPAEDTGLPYGAPVAVALLVGFGCALGFVAGAAVALGDGRPLTSWYFVSSSVDSFLKSPSRPIMTYVCANAGKRILTEITQPMKNKAIKK